MDINICARVWTYGQFYLYILCNEKQIKSDFCFAYLIREMRQRMQAKWRTTIASSIIFQLICMTKGWRSSVTAAWKEQEKIKRFRWLIHSFHGFHVEQPRLSKSQESSHQNLYSFEIQFEINRIVIKISSKILIFPALRRPLEIRRNDDRFIL